LEHVPNVMSPNYPIMFAEIAVIIKGRKLFLKLRKPKRNKSNQVYFKI